MTLHVEFRRNSFISLVLMSWESTEFDEHFLNIKDIGKNRNFSMRHSSADHFTRKSIAKRNVHIIFIAHCKQFCIKGLTNNCVHIMSSKNCCRLLLLMAIHAMVAVCRCNVDDTQIHIEIVEQNNTEILSQLNTVQIR